MVHYQHLNFNLGAQIKSSAFILSDFFTFSFGNQCGALLLFYSYCQRRVLGSRGLLVVYVFIFFQTLRVVPHGTKGTGPRFVTRQAYLRSQFRNNTNTVSTLVPLIHLLQVLCTRYASVAHHWAFQTSGRGWTDSKAVHGMECSGTPSLYWRSLSVGAAA